MNVEPLPQGHKGENHMGTRVRTRIRDGPPRWYITVAHRMYTEVERLQKVGLSTREYVCIE